MKPKEFFLASGVIFLAIFVLHGLRVIFGWEANIADLEIPAWASWIALIVSGYLSFNALSLGGYVKIK